MLLLRYSFIGLIFFHLIVAYPQLNLYYTDRLDISEEHVSPQHCLRTLTFARQSHVNRQSVFFCLSESAQKFHVESTDVSSKYTFMELARLDVTSEQLYLWSAPIDTIEHYQSYVDQSLDNDAGMMFYNCTLPRFGPQCQYELELYDSQYRTLYEMVDQFYQNYQYAPQQFTCYTHLQCDRGPAPACLDWTEICDGHVDCLDSDVDEEHCWQLEWSQCQDNEYRCRNGQCIPRSFYKDSIMPPDCLDTSDEIPTTLMAHYSCDTHAMAFRCDDIACNLQPLTSSCIKQRQALLLQAVFSQKEPTMPGECWLAFQCLILKFILDLCHQYCYAMRCVQLIEQNCPNIFYVPASPFLHKHIQFAHRKTDATMSNRTRVHHPYLCSNQSWLGEYFLNTSKTVFNQTTCYRPRDETNEFVWNRHFFLKWYRLFWSYDLISNGTSSRCDRVDSYRCNNSIKCIAIHRRNNGIDDCPHGDDEDQGKHHSKDDIQSLIEVDNWLEDEEKKKLRYARNNISFQTICDGFLELLPITIDGQNQTDESECDYWQCNNIYTRCDKLWNCPDGVDELDCDSTFTSSLECSSHPHHVCISPQTYEPMCLPLIKANDGHIDCLGGSDEFHLCRAHYKAINDKLFHCITPDNRSSCLKSSALCDGSSDCSRGEDEHFCARNRTFNKYKGICWDSAVTWYTDTEKFVCENMKQHEKEYVAYFTLDGMNKSIEAPRRTTHERLIDKRSSRDGPSPCHHGLGVRVWLGNDSKTTRTCLCPPNFYGDRCQYQNQRVSLAIQFRAFSDSWETPFAIVISLIDDRPERVVHSYEQLTYLSMRDCRLKYEIYLLYATRPKNSTHQYFIQIDFYERLSLIHRGSLFYPINFSFLPVHRLAYLIDIPRKNDRLRTCSARSCVHGRCIRYSNDVADRSFCQCDSGWSGQSCAVPYRCTCSPDSLCAGVLANKRSICVCPAHTFGPRCSIHSPCHLQTNQSICQNHGQCVPSDDSMLAKQALTCVCPRGFSGARCEVPDNQLIVSFEDTIRVPQSIFIHFIEVIRDGPPRRATTFQTRPLRQDSIVIPWSKPFHLVFIQFPPNHYYLTVSQTSYQPSTTLRRTIQSRDRCPHIRELFNETFVHFHLLRRIKYYHLLCQQNNGLSLSCFSDDVHLCLCYQDNHRHLANCFKFNHHMTFDCFGHSHCENGGQCFQDAPDCPQRSICVCPSCFYGRQCQFSTRGFGLSLDAILGYHILPHVSLLRQPNMVQISLAVTVLFLLAGLINGLLAWITFRNQIIREVGCGVYLYSSSATSLCTTTIFGLKFFILLLAQMAHISNRSFLTFQCRTIDFFLRICLNMDQWLHACVALERVMTAKKGPMFNRKTSKQAARVVIAVLVLVMIGSSIHDPIHRRLSIDDGDDHQDRRIWCIVSYESKVQVWHFLTHIFHFFGPFLTNLISAILLITSKTHQQSTVRTHRTHRQLLRDQFRQHQHLLIAPSLLVILALPRLVIGFVSTCMTSASDSWFFLVGYFVSFIPSMLTFAIFILPSKFYRRHFYNSVTPLRMNMQRRFLSS